MFVFELHGRSAPLRSHSLIHNVGSDVIGIAPGSSFSYSGIPAELNQLNPPISSPAGIRSYIGMI